MERNFIRIRSVKDIVTVTTLIISGSVLVALPTSTSINILGFFLVFTGLILAIFLKSGYKDSETGVRYNKTEMYFDKSRLSALSQAISKRMCPTDVVEINKGNGLRLDIYHNRKNDRSYIQLYEYVPYKYEPCSAMYEHSYENVSEILK